MEVILGSETYIILLYEHLKNNHNITNIQYDNNSIIFTIPKNSNFIDSYLQSFKNKTPGIETINLTEKSNRIQNNPSNKPKRKCWSCLD